MGLTIQNKAALKTNGKDKLFDAITKATNLLVQSDHFDDDIDRALEIIGKAAEINRINIFEGSFDSKNNKTLFSQVYEWIDSTLTRQIKDFDNCFYSTASSGLLNKLKNENFFIGNINDLSESEKNVFEAKCIKSFMLVPIFLGKNFWGFVGFDVCANSREWTSDEEHLLFSMACTIGSEYLQNKEHLELIEAKEKAEESKKLKSAFLSNLNHEIRTPMNSIMGFISLLGDPGLTNEIKDEYINILKKSGERLLNTIYDIIDISKIESGQMSVSMENFNLVEFMENLYTLFKPKAEAKGLTFNRVFCISEDKAIIKTDKNKLFSVMSNLIGNALKYTKNGFVEYGCSVNMTSIQFYVKDSGIGIPECKRQVVFESFVQADVSRSREYEGSGLGLSISKAYIELLGGNIWVESEENIGSTFFFLISVSNIETEYASEIPKNSAFN